MHSDWSITQNINKRADWLTLFALVTGTITWPPSLKLNWLSIGYQVQSFSIVSLGAVDTILLGMYRYLMFLF